MISPVQPSSPLPNRPFRITWTADADRHLIALHADGMGLRRIAAAIGRSRHAVAERAARLGLRTPAPAERDPSPEPGPVLGPVPGPEPAPDFAREPLRPGHPISWSAITAGTCLEGTPYTGCDHTEAV